MGVTPNGVNTHKAIEPLLQLLWNSIINDYEKLFNNAAYTKEIYAALEQLHPLLKLLLKKQLPKKEITDALFRQCKNKIPHLFLPYEHLRFSPSSFSFSSDWNPGILRSVSYCLEDTKIFASYAEKFVALIDCSHNQLLRTFSLDSCCGISSVDLVPLKEALLVQSSLGSALYDSNKGIILYPPKEKRHTAKILAVSKNSTRLLVYGYPTRSLKIVDTLSDNYAYLGGHNSAEVTTARFNQNEREVLSAAVDGTIKIWDLSTRKCTRTIKAHSRPIRVALYNNTEKKILSADQESIKLWDIVTGKCLLTISASAPNSNITHVLYADPLEQLIAILDNGTIVLRELKNGLCIGTLNSYMGAIQSIAINSTKTKILAGDEMKNIYQWDLRLIQKLYYIIQELSLYDWLYISCLYKRKVSLISPCSLLTDHPFLTYSKNLNSLILELLSAPSGK